MAKTSKSVLSDELFARRMTIAVDNNGIRKREARLPECYEWKVRPELVQEELSTGQSCNPWTEPLLPPFGFRVGLKVDSYAVACTVGNGFPKPGESLDIAEDVGAADDGKPRRLPLEN